MASETKTVWQPIHPDILPRLLPEFVEYHNRIAAYQRPIQDLPWDPACRNTQPVAGGSDPLPVGSVHDYPLSKCQVRVFTPKGEAPGDGWPVMLYFHGGGWTLGNIDTENAFSTNLCERANCVVVSVDYRLGPEQPYPAAVEDAEEALHWVLDKREQLNVNVAKFAVGGSSSGGNLAAIVTHQAVFADPPIPLVFQVLVVPVTDNTASPSGVPHASWKECANTVPLTPAKMLWFRNKYTPNGADWTKWDNSPIFAPEESFKQTPPAWIGVAELDILRDEGIAYAEKLKNAGVPVELRVYKGAPHPILAMDGTVLEIGKQLITDAVEALAKAFRP